MEDSLRELTRRSLEPIQRSKGGLLGVDGWILRGREDMWNFLEVGVEDDLNQYDGFDNPSEVQEFIQGIGRYSDRNSFFYGHEDKVRQENEGFIQPPYCHRCVAEATEASIDEEIEPEIEPYSFSGTEEGFRPGFEKEVHEVRYLCERHPETFFSMRKTEYVEK